MRTFLPILLGLGVVIYFLPQPSFFPIVTQSIFSAEIGNQIWEDLDGDGLQDTNEPGLAGVTITLFSCDDTNTPLQSTTSDSLGLYSFSNLPAGEYILHFSSQPGYNFTAQNTGSNPEIDSDINLDGFSPCISVAADTLIQNIDAGFDPCNSQAVLFCLDPINVIMGTECFQKVTPDIILLGDDICFDLFSVELFWNGQALGDTITVAQVGESVEAKVTHLASGNFCSSQLTIIDNLAPQILECDTLYSDCTSSIHPDSIGGILAQDNCYSPILSYSDSIIEGNCTDPFLEMIIRQWTASDSSGNTASCDQLIFRQQPDGGEIIFPIDLDGDNGPLVTCDGGSTHPDSTGWPTIEGEPIKGGTTCGFKSFYFDQTTQGDCAGNSTILRSWTVKNNCTNESYKYDQFIEISDHTPPLISCPPDATIGVSTDVCLADILLPEVSVTDDCSAPADIEIFVTLGPDTLFDNGGWWLEVPKGSYPVSYYAVDDCGNANSCTFQVTVVDNVPPQPICENIIVIGLGAGGNGSACWESFDNGSWDNCQIVAIKLKRSDASFSQLFEDCLDFDCEDVGDTVGVRVRVYDIAGDWTEEEAIGRFNEVEVAAIIQDNQAPSIACPFDITLDCFEDYLDIPELSNDPTQGTPVYRDSLLLGYYGAAFDNCELDSIVVAETNEPDNCGEGTIQRNWTAFDKNGLSKTCVQSITLENSQGFYINDSDCTDADPNDGIIWPCDYLSSDCGGGTGTDVAGEPIIDPSACNLIGISYSDQILTVQDSACFKIYREWLVLDWCQPDPNSDLDYVYWTYTQVIKVLNSDPPLILSSCSDTTICASETNCNQNPVSLVVEAEDDCTPFTDLYFEHKIDLYNNNSYDIIGAGNDASSFFPIGTHKIQWQVEDRCGNISSCSYTFTIEDCAPPTPICKFITSTINPASGGVTISAASFENGDSYDNCTAYNLLKFSFSSDPADSIRFFDCDQLQNNPEVDIQLWATDEAGNQSFCETTLFLTDPIGYCDSGNLVNVLGSVITPKNTPVALVDVSVLGGAQGSSFQQTTGSDGLYSIPVTPGLNYSIDPGKNLAPLNGVTTYDLVLISQHILNIKPLDSPYKIIAADASGDGKVTTFDIIELRKLVLHIYGDLPNVPSWRFVDATYDFPNPGNPFVPAFPEVIALNDVIQDQPDNDFIAIKTGDVDLNADPLSLTQGEDRRNPAIRLTTDDRTFSQGEIVKLPIYLPGEAFLAGFQFSLSFDENVLSIQSMDSPLPEFSNKNYSFDKNGTLNISWSNFGSGNLSEKLLEIHFLALKDGQLSDLISISEDALSSEIILGTSTRSFTNHYAHLGFREAATGLNVVIQPNPFRDQTSLLLHSDATEQVQVEILDAQGKIVRQYPQFTLEEGRTKSLSLSREDLPSSGLFYYHLTTSSGEVISGKMMLIK
jgi:hypothetical protein